MFWTIRAGNPDIKQIRFSQGCSTHRFAILLLYHPEGRPLQQVWMKKKYFLSVGCLGQTMDKLQASDLPEGQSEFSQTILQEQPGETSWL